MSKALQKGLIEHYPNLNRYHSPEVIVVQELDVVGENFRTQKCEGCEWSHISRIMWVQIGVNLPETWSGNVTNGFAIDAPLYKSTCEQLAPSSS